MSLLDWIGCILIALVLFVAYELCAAPTVYPDSCYDVKIRNGRLKCGGPCRKTGPLPCEPMSKWEART